MKFWIVFILFIACIMATEDSEIGEVEKVPSPRGLPPPPTAALPHSSSSKGKHHKKKKQRAWKKAFKKLEKRVAAVEKQMNQPKATA